MTQFVVIYDRVTGEAKIEQFSGDGAVEAALEARFDAERENFNSDVEVVSLVADSIEDLQATHARYFQAIGSGTDMLEDLERLIAS